MTVYCYSIYDRKALVYHPPFFAATDGAATRDFSNVANDLNTNIGRHPMDFVLYCIGQYDDSNGAMLPFGAPQHIVDAMALVKPSPALFPQAAQ